MAERPWVKPEEVAAYTEYKQVQERTPARLSVDISRAEQYVISYTNNTFADAEKFPTIPEPVKTAVILLAEAYAYNAGADSTTGGKRLKSETYDDYSYTAESATFSIDDVFADVKPLLDPYCIEETRGGITLRMRKL